MKREVGCTLEATVYEASEVAFQLAVATPGGASVREQMSITIDDTELTAHAVVTHTGSRMHIVQAPVGKLRVRYAAVIDGEFDPQPVTPTEAWEYLRPSRYIESDRFNDVAAELFGGLPGPVELLAHVTTWTGNALVYVPGSSGPMDGASQTMNLGAGVCRDYAHLVAAMLRARGVAARVVAVYAPGCSPMDFHAVVEANVNGRWQVVDATLMAPRQSFVRIATGRDAADTSFMSNNGGVVTLDEATVFAVVDGELPRDDVEQLAAIR